MVPLGANQCSKNQTHTLQLRKFDFNFKTDLEKIRTIEPFCTFF